MSTTNVMDCVAAEDDRPSAEETVNRYLDGELGLESQPELFTHLASCQACRETMDAVMTFRRVAREEYIAVPPSADERFFDRLADLKERTDRLDRAGDRESLWRSRRSVSLGTTVLMAFCLFVLGLYLPRASNQRVGGLVLGEQEMVDLDAPVYGLMNTIYVITPGVTVESARLVSLESP
jgi:anti-sigma factor RsiW